MSSQPALKRINPPGNGIPTPTGTPFCGGVDAAKTGGFVDQLTGREKRLGMLTVCEHKADYRAKRCIWRLAMG